MNWSDRPWDEWVEFCSEEHRGNKLGCYVKKLELSVTVYSIWRERNNRVFRKEFKPEEIVVQDIIGMVRCRLMPMRNIIKSSEDRWLLKY